MNEYLVAVANQDDGPALKEYRHLPDLPLIRWHRWNLRPSHTEESTSGSGILKLDLDSA